MLYQDYIYGPVVETVFHYEDESLCELDDKESLWETEGEEFLDSQ